jgi:tagatose-1,6-bisphosphate aldolase
MTNEARMINQPARASTRIGLDAIADRDGVFSIIAMDQRNTLRRMFAAVGRTAEPAAMRAAKVDVARALTPAASGILLDPDFGVPAVREAGALAPTCGLLVAAEPPDRSTWNGEPRATRDPALDAAWVRGLGGHAMKFLVQLRPGRPRTPGAPDLEAELLDVVGQVVADCRERGIPSVVENLVYQLPGEQPLSAGQRTDLIVEAARVLSEAGPDLLKIEYPGSVAGARRIAEVVRGPWAVLSAGVAFDQFEEALRVSCDEGGASGFIAGRSVWKEAIGLDAGPRREFLDTVARPRLDTLLASVAGRARPWHRAAAAAVSTDVQGAPR